MSLQAAIDDVQYLKIPRIRLHLHAKLGGADSVMKQPPDVKVPLKSQLQPEDLSTAMTTITNTTKNDFILSSSSQNFNRC